MTSTFVILTLCLILSFTVCLGLTKLAYTGGFIKLKFIPAWLTSLIGFVVLYLSVNITHDQLHPIPLYEIFTLFGLSGLMCVFSLFEKLDKYTPILNAVSATFLSLLVPSDFYLFNGYLPFIADRALIIALVFIISHCLKYLNNIDGLVGIQSSFIFFAIFILYLADAVPFLIGGFAVIMLGIAATIAIFSWFPSAIKLSPAHCNALGLIIAWLLLRSSVEDAASCTLIALMYLLVEIITIFYKAVISRKESKPIENLSNAYQTFLSGLSVVNVCISVSKIFIMLSFFCFFQAYAPNEFSIPAFALVIVVWMINHMLNWQQPKKTLKEINKDFIEDVKENLQDIKSSLSKDKTENEAKDEISPIEEKTEEEHKEEDKKEEYKEEEKKDE